MSPILPVELVLLVLDELAIQPSSTSSLRRCALVCKQWHSACCPHMFAHFVAQGTPAPASFSHVHNFLLAHPHISSVVRTVCFRGISDSSWPSIDDLDDAEFTGNDMQRIQELCPDLNTIRVEYCVCVPTVTAPLPNPPTSVRLELCGLHESRDCAPTSLLLLRAHWPVVDLEEVDWSMPLPACRTTFAPSSATALQITMGGDIHPEGEIAHLAHVEHLTLRAVTAVDTDVVRALMTQYAHGLRSLCLQVASDTLGELMTVPSSVGLRSPLPYSLPAISMGRPMSALRTLSDTCHVIPLIGWTLRWQSRTRAHS